MATEARDRIAARDRVEARRRQVEAPSTVRDDSEDEMVVSFPEFVFKEFIVAVAMTVFLIIVSIWLQAPLLGKANPGMTPNPSKAPWYFLGLQELLSRFPPLMAGVAFPTFVIVLMILVPFLDRNPSRRPSERKVAIILFALYTTIVVALVIIGTFFHGHDFPIQVQQLFPKVQVNGQFMVERCITCHVPDIQKIGPQEAAKRLGPN